MNLCIGILVRVGISNFVFEFVSILGFCISILLAKGKFRFLTFEFRICFGFRFFNFGFVSNLDPRCFRFAFLRQAPIPT